MRYLSVLAPRPVARLRLFCFPYAGGGASIFRDWVAELPPDVEISAILLPGRESRWTEPPVKRLSELVGHIVNELVCGRTTPFALFGYSMGAVVAFEVARELRRRHASPPEHLIVSAARAPQRPPRFPPIHRLPDGPFIERLRRLGATPDEILGNPELMSLVLPAIRADFEAYETYVYRAGDKLDCPISAFGGREDRRVNLAELAAWGEQTRSRFSMLTWPGGHFFIHKFRSSLISAVLHTLSAAPTSSSTEPRNSV